MTGQFSSHSMPREVAVVGAGMVGLATAWFLQERDVAVTVIDRADVAAGASWGNAGWLTPGLAMPLPEPAVLRYGLRAVLSPSSPVYVPPRFDPRLFAFLARFARNSTARRWRAAMQALAPMNRQALAAFDRLGAGGVATPTREAAPFLAAYRAADDRATLVHELKEIQSAGAPLNFDLLTGSEARELEPLLGPSVAAAVRLHGQRFIDPSAYVHQLADAVLERGGRFRMDSTVVAVHDRLDRAEVVAADGTRRDFDAAILANGAWLGELACPHGVRTIVQAGRGYSFSVKTARLPAGPVYLPAQRVACTPLDDRLRIAGMMEFHAPDAALDPRRITAIADAVSTLLDVDPDDRADEWVGPRPCTPDGLPLIGRTESPRTFVAGGHGMWGITLGPVTGLLLAELATTGRMPAELAPFDPLRR